MLKLISEDVRLPEATLTLYKNALNTTTVEIRTPNRSVHITLTDDQVNEVYQALSPKTTSAAPETKYSRTLGELNGTDLGMTRVEFRYSDSIISGVITELSFERDTIGPMSWKQRTVALTVGGITLEDLSLSTPCRLLRISTS